MTSALQPGKVMMNSSSSSSQLLSMQQGGSLIGRMSSHHQHGSGNNSNGKKGSPLDISSNNRDMESQSRDVNSQKNYFKKDEGKETGFVNSDRLRLLLFNHKSRNHLYKEQVTLKNLFQVGIEKQPTKKYNHNQLSDNCFGETNQEKFNGEEMNSIIKPKWLKSIVDNQCDLGFNENGYCTKTNNMQKIQENYNINETQSKKVSKETNDVKKKNGMNRKMEKTEKSFNSVMLELFKERSTEIQPHDIQNNDSMYTRLSKSWNRFLFWWMKWKKDFTTSTIHQFLKSYDPVMRTFECIFLFFETFRIPYPIRYAVHQLRHFLYLIFQFVWTSTFLFEENSEFERELLSHNNRRNDSQIYNSDPRYYYDDVNYYSQY